MPGHWGSPRGPSGELLGAHTFYLSATLAGTWAQCGLFHAWEAIVSSLSVVFHKQRFPIAPQWIPPTLTACLTPTECLEASDSAENAPAMLHSWNVVLLPGIRWVRWGGRGDELRLQGVVPGSPGTDQTLATVGGRPTSVNRHRSRVVGHSAHEGHLCSTFPAPSDSQTSAAHPP